MSEEILSTGKFLNEGQYWKWRYFTCNIFLNEVKYKEAELRYTNMSKDMEIAKLKLELFRLSVLANAKEKVETVKAEYLELRKEIEESLDVSLTDCAIDDYTFEVKAIVKLPS
jgi:uncharacterized membrane protein YgaE (UPF0421/DUF939 family)